MQLTEQQVLNLAPDNASANNGKKLAQLKQWPTLGQSPRAMWGECQGSGSKPYQVRVDLTDFASKCSCPSFKFPCKHAIGLLVLAANQPASMSLGAEPEWVSEWLNKRSDNAAKKEARAAVKAQAPVDEEAQRKRVEKRDNRVRDGINGLQLWLEDLVRNGLASLPAAGPKLWQQQAARLADAQATGLSNRVRVLADVPGMDEDWPSQLLAELGKLALAVRAYERMDQLMPDLQESLRQYIGFTVREEEVLASGNLLLDRWQVIGQLTDNSERIRVQRTWLLGEVSGRRALLLQFAASAQPFAMSWLPGMAFEGQLAFYPGSSMQRAVLKGPALPLPLPTTFSQAFALEQLLDDAAATLAANPWHEQMATVLQAVVPVLHEGRWYVANGKGSCLPLTRGEHWLWLAISGGHLCDVAVEWDGQAIRPLGLFANGYYQVLTESI